jgi:membrane protease YdiL (CAAX protease family)
LFALPAPVLILFGAAFANLSTGGSRIELPRIYLWLGSVLINLPFAPLWEELGWRGFLLSRLQSTRASFAASLLVGATWAPWHAPLQATAYKALPNINVLLAFAVFCSLVIGLSVILAWVFNRGRGNLSPCILFHSVFNNTSPYLIDSVIQKDGLSPMIWAAVTVWAVAIFLRVWAGNDLGSIRNTDLQTSF